MSLFINVYNISKVIKHFMSKKGRTINKTEHNTCYYASVSILKVFLNEKKSVTYQLNSIVIRSNDRDFRSIHSNNITIILIGYLMFSKITLFYSFIIFCSFLVGIYYIYYIIIANTSILIFYSFTLMSHAQISNFNFIKIM